MFEATNVQSYLEMYFHQLMRFSEYPCRWGLEHFQCWPISLKPLNVEVNFLKWAGTVILTKDIKWQHKKLSRFFKILHLMFFTHLALLKVHHILVLTTLYRILLNCQKITQPPCTAWTVEHKHLLLILYKIPLHCPYSNDNLVLTKIYKAWKRTKDSWFAKSLQHIPAMANLYNTCMHYPDILNFIVFIQP